MSGAQGMTVGAEDKKATRYRLHLVGSGACKTENSRYVTVTMSGGVGRNVDSHDRRPHGSVGTPPNYSELLPVMRLAGAHATATAGSTNRFPIPPPPESCAVPMLLPPESTRIAQVHRSLSNTT